MPHVPAHDSPACPICGGPSVTWIRRAGREMRECGRCRFRWIPEGVKRSDSGRSIYDDDPSVFFAGGSADYYLDETARDAAAAKLAWVVEHAPTARYLVDVGANVGHFAAAAAQRFDAVGIEPNVHAVRWAAERLHAPVTAGSIYDDRSDFSSRFDAITMFDVIEHLPDPRTALRQCHAWLRAGGCLFITTPDSGSLMARVLGRHWYYVDLDEHIALFSAANLKDLVEQSGFRVRATRTFGRRYRFSYIERRLKYLAEGAAVMRLAHMAAQPLRLWPKGRVTLNLGDVVGVVAERE